MKYYKIEKVFIHTSNEYDLGALTETQIKQQIKGFKLFQKLNDKTFVYNRKNCKYFYVVYEL